MADGRAYLSELLDGVLDLLIENPAVGNDNDGIEYRGVIFLKADQLVCKPGNRIGLAAPG